MNKYIKSRIHDEDFQQLQILTLEYNFKSVYQIVCYIIYCLLRVADADRDNIDDELPYEIEEMFKGLSTESHMINRSKKNKKVKIHKWRFVKARVSEADFERMKSVAMKYHFPSIYNTVGYSVQCFLKAVNRPKLAVSDYDDKDEINNMFEDYSNAESKYNGEKPKRRCNATVITYY
jgi:hypothetical protein